MNRLISGVRGAEIGAANLAQVAHFYETIWGLEPIKQAQDGVICFRGTQAEHPILTIVAGGTSARRIIYNARGEAALEELYGRIKTAGLPVSKSYKAFDDGFGIGFDSRDPEGRMTRFVAFDEIIKPSIKDKFTKVTHFNLNSGNYDAMRTYMRDVLGFLVVDESRNNGFFNCDSDHHCMVIGRVPMKPTLNHIAFEMPEINSMMRMCGTMRENGYPIEWGVGRHGPGDNTFAYFAGPEEMPIECTAEVLQIDATYVYRGVDEWNFPPGRMDLWGVTNPPSPRIKRIQTLFPFVELTLKD